MTNMYITRHYSQWVAVYVNNCSYIERKGDGGMEKERARDRAGKATQLK